MVWSPTRPRDKRDRRRPPALWGVPSHIAHCCTLHMLDTAHAAFQTTLKAQMTHNTVHSAQGAHQSVRCTQHCVCELPTHKAHIAYGAEHTHCTLNNTNSTLLLWKKKDSLGVFSIRLSMQNTAVIVGFSWSLGRKAEVLLVPLGLLANWKLG